MKDKHPPGRSDASITAARQSSTTGGRKEGNSAEVNLPVTPLLSERTGRSIMRGAFAFLVLVQFLYLVWIGNGLGKYSDGFSEANLVRAVDGYLNDGLTSHHGLPRILFRYQQHFPGRGMDKDVVGGNGLVKPEFRQGFPDGMADPDQWVYTHYPPGPELLTGIIASVVGLEPLWVLRLFPLGVGLLGTAFFFRTLVRLYGADRAALVAVACVALPLYHTCMPSVHYQGYSFALLLLQISLLLRILWEPAKPRGWYWPVLFLFGFLQGWLSFDQAFVVCLVPLPLWLLRRAEGVQPKLQWLVASVGLLGVGFALAHLLHFLQVAGELGGIQAALDEFRRTAGERSGRGGTANLPRLLVKYLHLKSNQFGFSGSLGLGGYYYLREVLVLRGLAFGPFMFLALLAIFFTARVAGTKPRRQFWAIPWLTWPGPASVIPALGAAWLVSLLWLFVMPAHVVGNSHITVRHLFVLYFCLVLILAKSLSPRGGAQGGP